MSKDKNIKMGNYTPSDNNVYDIIMDKAGISEKNGKGVSGPVCYAVYMAILRYHNHLTGGCFPSIETISKTAKVSITSVKRCLKRLVEIGVLDYIPGTYDRSGKNNTANSFWFPMVKGLKRGTYCSTQSRKSKSEELKEQRESGKTQEQINQEREQKLQKKKEKAKKKNSKQKVIEKIKTLENETLKYTGDFCFEEDEENPF